VIKIRHRLSSSIRYVNSKHTTYTPSVNFSSRVEFMDDSSLMADGPNTERHIYYKSSIVSMLTSY